MTFQELCTFRQEESRVKNRYILGLDPGETTGWCLFLNNKLLEQGQITTVIKVKDDKTLYFNQLKDLFDRFPISRIVMEDYHIYAHKLQQHTYSPVLTLRLIGAVEYLCWTSGCIDIHYQTASQAKGFVTDEKLKDWGFYIEGQRHSRDSIRHVCYHLLFNCRKEVKI